MSWPDVIPPPSTMTVDEAPRPKVVLYDAQNKPLKRAVQPIGYRPSTQKPEDR